MKENITQVVLIILSILIAFGIDRAYESYKIEKRKGLFFKDQINQLEEEMAMLSKNIEEAIDLKNKTERGLQFFENKDSVIHYTQWLGTISYFKPEISSLRELGGIYNVNETLDVELKKDFQTLYRAYDNIKFYEKEYTLIISNYYMPFWKKHYNSFYKSYPDKNIFISNEYLNIVQHSIGIIDSRIEAYEITKKSQENFIKNLKKASH